MRIAFRKGFWCLQMKNARGVCAVGCLQLVLKDNKFTWGSAASHSSCPWHLLSDFSLLGTRAASAKSQPRGPPSCFVQNFLWPAPPPVLHFNKRHLLAILSFSSWIKVKKPLSFPSGCLHISFDSCTHPPSPSSRPVHWHFGQEKVELLCSEVLRIGASKVLFSYAQMNSSVDVKQTYFSFFMIGKSPYSCINPILYFPI